MEDAIEMIQSVTCPDDKTVCPDGTTCCKRYDGGYFCCPTPDGVCCEDRLGCCPSASTCCKHGCCHYPNAVCCEDGIHCCPHWATKCDLQHNRCIGPHFLSMLMGLPEFNNIDSTVEKIQSPFQVLDICVGVMCFENLK